ncbi:MAG: D-alanyl-D-alanine carboxypeptidase [Anaerosolibacter sp.]|uniref:M15 family metallopeptidase n=1 Tax=Anaerosolibacter sp. TaxID=1872527 RepID=UPI0026274C25|nr:M15 family metallopeptidase [Anaerosolibacter sp.]MDF2545208.1 D-alanyl-D-alanine carboxypeptidase [Anaerosolibacter sp.]
MKHKRYILLVAATLLLSVGCTKIQDAEAVKPPETRVQQNSTMEAAKIEEQLSFTVSVLPYEIIEKIDGVSWKIGSPVALEQLAYVKVLYWGFDGETHEGELVVHGAVAEEILEIFQILYESKFPIEKIRLVDEYGGNDDLSMEDNNTSAFNFREVADSKGVLSKHSYGIAIDINPIQNPYVTGGKISPAAGKNYIDRTVVQKGMIVKGDVCYKAFTDRGWTWGGEWKSLKDYQHFQKSIPLQ